MKKLLISLLLAPALGWLSAGVPVTPKFYARADYQFINGPAAAADVNGDGFPDLIGGGGSLVLLGDGKGGFQPQPRQQTIYGPIGFVAIDLNGDGKLDIVVAGELASGKDGTGTWGIGVCFGNGDGTFQPAVLYEAGSAQYVEYVVVGDFNGDGVPDVAAAAQGGVWLFAGKGGGAFSPGVVTPVNYPGGSNGFSGADLNGDGNLDLVVSTKHGFSILFGNGDGTFQPPVRYPLRYEGGSIAIANLNADGYPDVAVASGNDAVIYLNDGKGNFSRGKRYPIGVYGFTVGDVNGDGIPDLVSPLGYIRFGRGNGTFSKPAYYPTDSGFGIGGGNAVLADLRNNGLTDIVASGNLSVSVLLAKGKGKFKDGTRVVVPGADLSCGAIADYNGDGNPDVAVPTPQGITMLLGTGDGGRPYKTGASIALPGAFCPYVGDLNGDGIPDLLIPQAQTSGWLYVYAYLGKGDGTFVSKGYTALAAFGGMVVGDFNHDGKLDFAVADNLLVLGNGDGTFQTPKAFIPNPRSQAALAIVSGDLNGDGWPDILIIYPDWWQVYILLNDRHGGFTQTEMNVEDNAEALRVTLADLTGSGVLDMVVTPGAPHLYVYMGDGKGGFNLKGTTGPYLYNNGPLVAFADLNGDGIPDLEVTQYSLLEIWLGNGDGTFTSTAVYTGGGPEPGLLLNANLHGQPKGFADIIMPDATGPIWVLTNTTKH